MRYATQLSDKYCIIPPLPKQFYNIIVIVHEHFFYYEYCYRIGDIMVHVYIHIIQEHDLLLQYTYITLIKRQLLSYI